MRLTGHDLKSSYRETAQGGLAVSMAENYGTRLLLAADSSEFLPPSLPKGVALADDFELGMNKNLIVNGDKNTYAIVEDPLKPGNHVLRFRPAPALVSLIPNPDTVPAAKFADFELSLRLRLSALPLGGKKNGILMIRYGVQGNSGYQSILDIDNSRKDAPAWTFTPLHSFGKLSGVKPESVQPSAKTLPADTEWHRVTVKVSGGRHTLLFDGEIAGVSDFAQTQSGTLSLTPAWRFNSEGEFLEIDDIAICFPSRQSEQ